MVALSSAMGSGFAMAHGAGYDHTHALMESPGLRKLQLRITTGVELLLPMAHLLQLLLQELVTEL